MNSSQDHCYHCGLPNDQGNAFPVVIDNKARYMCCPGCQAVSESIVQMGLEDYYQFRESLPEVSPRNMEVDLEQMLFYDRDKVQEKYLNEDTSHHKSISLMVSGIVCSACTWLIESRIGKLAGISQVSVNQSTNRAKVRWDPEQIQLSDILKAITDLGYMAQPYDESVREQHLTIEKKRYLQRLAIAGIGMMQVMMYSLGFYLDLNKEMDPHIWELLRWVSLLISTPVVFYAASPFYMSAFKSLKNKAVNMDVPVTIAIFGAWIASTYATLVGTGEVYFDSVSMFVFFLLTGRYLQMIAIHKSGRALEERLGTQPETALRVTVNGEERILLEDVQKGDRLLVKAGQQVPCDGALIDDIAHLDESILTGESTPISKASGQSLAAGAINVADPFVMEVTERVENSTLANIIKLLQDARESKPRIQELADHIASYFVTAILFLATVTAIYWYINNPEMMFEIVLAVLVVTCPCALALATPVAITTAIGKMTSQSVLVNKSSALFNLNQATDVVFDKTGTLTTGRFVIKAIQTADGWSEELILKVVAAMERQSEHPIATAFEDAETAGMTVESLQRLPGIGIKGIVDGVPYRIGNELLINADSGEHTDLGDLVLYVVSNETCIATLRLHSELREEALDTIHYLDKLGINTHLLSGDHEEQVKAIANHLGFAPERVRSRVTPEDKLAYISQLQAQGKLAVMVGDGLNDSPAMAAASVSVAMAKATDITKIHADMILMNEHLSLVSLAHQLSIRTRSIIRQNLAWALSYNMIGVPLAMMGFITPWIAALGMSLSSLIVVVNALRLSK